MSKQDVLRISPDLALPSSAATATIVVYGGKGMGKTNFGAVFIEELAANGLRWVLVDPIGVSWGLRHSVDGKGAGVECLILGGAHGDIPIESTGGAVVADLVVDERVNVILDISRKRSGEMWSIAERVRFMNDYGKQLFRRQGGLVDGKRREPICQIIDEAARFIPQMIRAGQEDVAKCSNTWSTIVEEGRNIGLGVVLLTQRSARLNKDVAELADLMLAFRTVGPNSIDAVIDWLGAHLDKAQTKPMIEAVRALPVGSCMAVSPGWLQVEKIIAIRKRTTFDSSATPRPGEQAARVRGEGAKPDLGLYVARMKETIERAAAEDPRALKRRIAELEAVAKTAAAAPVLAPAKPAGMSETEREVMRSLSEKVAELERYGREREGQLAKSRALSLQLVEVLVQARAAKALDKAAQSPPAPREMSAPKPRAIASPGGAGEKMGKAERSILIALAQHGRSSRAKLAALTEYSSSGGGFGNALSALRTRGWMTGSDPLEISEAGVAALGSYEPLPSGDALFERWVSRCSKAEAKILQALQAAGGPRSKVWLAAETGYEASGGGFGNALSHLRTLGLIQGSAEIELDPEFAAAVRA